jgi:hypothetical protein
MKRKLVLSVIPLFLIVLLTGCGNAKTKETKTDTEKKIENKKPDKPVVSFILDGRLVESADYYCGWKLTGQENMLTLSIVYEREPKTNPPNLGFAIYNLKDISMPFNRLNGKLPGKSEQLFSLSAGLGLPKGKAADMNELSFSDNYKGLESAVQLSLLDTTAKIVSGRFEGTVQNANGKSMKVTEGKFERIPLKMIYSNKLY